jgi:nitrogen fixation-related uncharacterized protein
MNEHQSDIFFVLWIAFSIIMLLAISAIIIWAIRNKQFKNQDRARYLPLDAKLKKKESDDKIKGSAK